MERNWLKEKFNDNLFIKTIPKEYFIKKIKLKQNPKLRNNLNIFFNDSKKYFNTFFDDKYIIIGKKKIKSEKLKYHKTFSENITTKKIKNRNFLKRMTIKKNNELKESKDKYNNSPNKSKTKTEEKKKNFRTFEESALKQGQRFIDDKEVENIFKLYKEVRKINKYKCKKFLTLKDLKDKKINNIYNLRKTTRNFPNKFMSLKGYYGKKILKSNENQKKIEASKNEDNSISNKDMLISRDNTSMNDNDNYKTSSTIFTGSIKEELNMKNNFLPIPDYNEIKNPNYKFKTSNSKEIKDRNKLIKRQNQYISEDIDKTIKNKFADVLYLQESTFLSQKKNGAFQSKLNKYLSLKTKKPKNERLLLDNNSYRPNLEIKMKLNNLQQKLYPEKVYDWKKDLHSSENYFLTYGKLPVVEIIRSPINNKKPYSDRLFFEKNKYLQKNLPKSELKKITKDYKNTEKNYDALCVKGINLLKFEYDLFKKLKGRKIINDFERLMSPSSIKTRNFLTKIDKNIFTQKTKSSFILSDSL